MDLDADLAVGRDIEVGLGVIERRHPVHPAANAAAFGEDAVFVPFAFLDGGEHGLGVSRIGDDFVAAAFVVEFTVPTGTVVDLEAAHLGTVWDADAADLDAAVDEAGAGEAQFEAQVEVLIPLLGGEELVLRHGAVKRTAADLAILHAPPSQVALPAGEGFPIEERSRFGPGSDGTETGPEDGQRRLGQFHKKGSRQRKPPAADLNPPHGLGTQL